MHVVNNIHGTNRGLRSVPEHRGERGCRPASILQGLLLPRGRGREVWEEHRLPVKSSRAIGRPRVSGPAGVHHSTQTNPRGLLIGISVQRQVL